MSFYDTLRKNLTPELLTQVTDQLGDDFDFDLVPRSRLNKVIAQRNQLRDQLSGSSQIPGSSSKATGTASSASDDDDDYSTTSQSNASSINIDDLRRQMQNEKDAAIQELKFQYAALDKLRAVNAIDADLIIKAGLIDTSKFKLDASGKVEGLDEAVQALVKDRPVLFKAPETPPPTGTGKSGGEDTFSNVTSKEDFLKLSTEQQLAYKKANPETFKTFLQ